MSFLCLSTAIFGIFLSLLDSLDFLMWIILFSKVCTSTLLIIGAFLYSRTHTLSPVDMEAAKKLIIQAGLDPMAFCKISNQCFIETDPKSIKGMLEAQKLKEYIEKQSTPFWYLGQNFFRATESIAGELADWFDDPAILSDWLVSQQVKMIQEQPFVSAVHNTYKIMMKE